MNTLDTKKGFTMDWLEFGNDMNAMAIVSAVTVIGFGILFFTHKTLND